ncbi:MAG: hypothetical protein JNN05_08900, partial [Candidatus Omnitrophica bacterium]|nr:hypothetical protein [Candidatus Omnitrophota bacterium]
RKLEALFSHKIEKFKTSIRAQQDLAVAYKQEATKLKDRFRFRAIEAVEQNITAILESWERLTQPKDEWYLSKSKMVELLDEIRREYQMIAFLKTETGLVFDINSQLSDLESAVLSLQEYSKAVATELLSRLLGIREDFGNKVFSSQSQENMPDIQKSIDHFSKELENYYRVPNSFGSYALRINAAVTDFDMYRAVRALDPVDVPVHLNLSVMNERQERLDRAVLYETQIYGLLQELVQDIIRGREILINTPANVFERLNGLNEKIVYSINAVEEFLKQAKENFRQRRLFANRQTILLGQFLDYIKRWLDEVFLAQVTNTKESLRFNTTFAKNRKIIEELQKLYAAEDIDIRSLQMRGAALIKAGREMGFIHELDAAISEGMKRVFADIASADFGTAEKMFKAKNIRYDLFVLKQDWMGFPEQLELKVTKDNEPFDKTLRQQVSELPKIKEGLQKSNRLLNELRQIRGQDMIPVDTLFDLIMITVVSLYDDVLTAINSNPSALMSMLITYPAVEQANESKVPETLFKRSLEGYTRIVKLFGNIDTNIVAGAFDEKALHALAEDVLTAKSEIEKNNQNAPSASSVVKRAAGRPLSNDERLILAWRYWQFIKFETFYHDVLEKRKLTGDLASFLVAIYPDRMEDLDGHQPIQDKITIGRIDDSEGRLLGLTDGHLIPVRVSDGQIMAVIKDIEKISVEMKAAMRNGHSRSKKLSSEDKSVSLIQIQLTKYVDQWVAFDEDISLADLSAYDFLGDGGRFEMFVQGARQYVHESEAENRLKDIIGAKLNRLLNNKLNRDKTFINAWVTQILENAGRLTGKVNKRKASSPLELWASSKEEEQLLSQQLEYQKDVAIDALTMLRSIFYNGRTEPYQALEMQIIQDLTKSMGREYQRFIKTVFNQRKTIAKEHGSIFYSVLKDIDQKISDVVKKRQNYLLMVMMPLDEKGNKLTPFRDLQQLWNNSVFWAIRLEELNPRLPAAVQRKQEKGLRYYNSLKKSTASSAVDVIAGLSLNEIIAAALGVASMVGYGLQVLSRYGEDVALVQARQQALTAYVAREARKKTRRLFFFDMNIVILQALLKNATLSEIEQARLTRQLQRNITDRSLLVLEIEIDENHYDQWINPPVETEALKEYINTPASSPLKRTGKNEIYVRGKNRFGEQAIVLIKDRYKQYFVIRFKQLVGHRYFYLTHLFGGHEQTVGQLNYHLELANLWRDEVFFSTMNYFYHSLEQRRNRSPKSFGQNPIEVLYHYRNRGLASMLMTTALNWAKYHDHAPKFAVRGDQITTFYTHVFAMKEEESEMVALSLRDGPVPSLRLAALHNRIKIIRIYDGTLAEAESASSSAQKPASSNHLKEKLRLLRDQGYELEDLAQLSQGELSYGILRKISEGRSVSELTGQRMHSLFLSLSTRMSPLEELRQAFIKATAQKISMRSIAQHSHMTERDVRRMARMVSPEKGQKGSVARSANRKKVLDTIHFLLEDAPQVRAETTIQIINMLVQQGFTIEEIAAKTNGVVNFSTIYRIRKGAIPTSRVYESIRNLAELAQGPAKEFIQTVSGPTPNGEAERPTQSKDTGKKRIVPSVQMPVPATPHQDVSMTSPTLINALNRLKESYREEEGSYQTKYSGRYVSHFINDAQSEEIFVQKTQGLLERRYESLYTLAKQTLRIVSGQSMEERLFKKQVVGLLWTALADAFAWVDLEFRTKILQERLDRHYALNNREDILNVLWDLNSKKKYVSRSKEISALVPEVRIQQFRRIIELTADHDDSYVREILNRSYLKLLVPVENAALKPGLFGRIGSPKFASLEMILNAIDRTFASRSRLLSENELRPMRYRMSVDSYTRTVVQMIAQNIDRGHSKIDYSPGEKILIVERLANILGRLHYKKGEDQHYILTQRLLEKVSGHLKTRFTQAFLNLLLKNYRSKNLPIDDQSNDDYSSSSSIQTVTDVTASDDRLAFIRNDLDLLARILPFPQAAKTSAIKAIKEYLMKNENVSLAGISLREFKLINGLSGSRGGQIYRLLHPEDATGTTRSKTSKTAAARPMTDLDQRLMKYYPSQRLLVKRIVTQLHNHGINHLDELRSKTIEEMLKLSFISAGTVVMLSALVPAW